MTRQKKKNSVAKRRTAMEKQSFAPRQGTSGPGPSTSASGPSTSASGPSTASTSASTSSQRTNATGTRPPGPRAVNRPKSPSFEEQYIQLLIESEMIRPNMVLQPPPTFPNIPGFPRNPYVDLQRRREYDVPLPEGASPLPEGFPYTQADLEVAYAHFAALEDEDCIKFEEANIEYQQALRDALECVPETDEDHEDMKEIWESLGRVKRNMIPPVDIREENEDSTQPCSSLSANLAANIRNGIARHRRFADRPSALPIDPNDGRAAPQLPMENDDSGEGPSSSGPSSSGPSSSNAGPSTSEDGSPSYSPSSPLDGEGEQCAIELRAATDDTDNATNSFCPSPVNSSESEPEIRVVNEIRANPRVRAAHERLMQGRRTRPRGSVNFLEQAFSGQPLDLQFGFDPSQASQQPCSSSSAVEIDTSAIEFSFDPFWPSAPKKEDDSIKESNPIDLSALARALEGLTDTTAIQEVYKNAYEKKLSDLTTENQLVTAENMKLKEKLVELEQKLNERNGESSSTEAPAQPAPQQPSNKNKKKKNKKKGKK